MRILIFIAALMSFTYSQTPPIEPGVSQELARWRAAHYSDVRYKLELTIEKMSPVLKGRMEVRVNVSPQAVPPALAGGGAPATKAPSIILDWRRIRGHEEKSSIANVSINGREVTAEESNEHLIFRDGVVAGENVIKLDFTSPILPSGSAITRYIDKEDGSEYIYSLFVPSDASTAFPVFDQPDLKARFTLHVIRPPDWMVITNAISKGGMTVTSGGANPAVDWFEETKPISTYVFAFAAGPWQRVSEPGAVATGSPELGLRNSDSGFQRGAAVNPDSEIRNPRSGDPIATAPGSDPRGRVGASDRSLSTSIYLRKSQLAKFQPHAAEVFRLNREAIKYFEEYFDYKFPFPKYDLVLIPEFPFGGMEHAGATFLREASIIFPQEPTKNDHVNRATLIFHEAAHQWFGDTVTMRWFDDLWLKEGFATFTAYKAMEKIMPEMNSWKVFYERIKQGAYQTDSTKGTTAIYQPIANLSAAKSAYGNIVYNKAPAFLRQAEFYLGEEKFRAGVRAFLRKHEFGNAGWEDLVKEFADQRPASMSGGEKSVRPFANTWVTRGGLKLIRTSFDVSGHPAFPYQLHHSSNSSFEGLEDLPMEFQCLVIYEDGTRTVEKVDLRLGRSSIDVIYRLNRRPLAVIPNSGDYGYGIFLLDATSREYVLKNIQNENDLFLRSMMWGALWDSVREGELDPKQYVELALRVLSAKTAEDESTTASILNRVSTAMTYYISEPPAVPGASAVLNSNGCELEKLLPQSKPNSDLRCRLENLLFEKMRTAPTLGQRITYYRAFLNVASSDKARSVLKEMLRHQSEPEAVATGSPAGSKRSSLSTGNPVATARGSDSRVNLPLKTKDRFDIVTKLASLGDPDAERLLADLEKTETSDDAKRYAYAARAAFPTKETKEKYWNDFVNNKQISESWIEAAFGPFNSVRHADLTLPYLERALRELPNHKRNRKIFFVNGWLGAFIGGQRSEEALKIVNKFLADNPNLDRDLRLKILENVDIIERAVKIRGKYLGRGDSGDEGTRGCGVSLGDSVRVSKLAYASDSIKPPALAGGYNRKPRELANASDRS